MKARVLTLKLGFLCCLLSSEDNNIAIKNFPHSCHTGCVAQQRISLDSKRGMQFDYMLNNTDHLIAMLYKESRRSCCSRTVHERTKMPVCQICCQPQLVLHLHLGSRSRQLVPAGAESPKDTDLTSLQWLPICHIGMGGLQITAMHSKRALFLNKDPCQWECSTPELSVTYVNFPAVVATSYCCSTPVSIHCKNILVVLTTF